MGYNKSKQLVNALFSLVFLFIIGFGGYFVYSNKNTLFSAVVDKTTIYTQEEVDNKVSDAYNQGYIDAVAENPRLKKQIEDLQTTIADKEKTINEKQNIINENEKIIKQNELTIAELTNSSSIIIELKNQNEELQTINASNLENITSLNNDISSLQEQITQLNSQIQTNATKIAEYETLKQQKQGLENSILYYQQFIQALETDTQAVAIFEVNNTIHKAQILTKGSYASATNPADMDNKHFVGWTVNNEIVNIANYPVNTNTKFIAKFSEDFIVTFLADNEIFKTNTVAKNASPRQLLTTPTKEGYDFDGFTLLNGTEIIDYTTYPITANTTFVAKFTKVHTVKFINGSEIISTQKIRNGNKATSPRSTTIVCPSENHKFLGFSIDQTNIVNVSTYPIMADTIFIAKFEVSYTVTFKNGDNVISSQKIKENKYATLPTITDDRFMGWTTDGQTIIENITATPVTSNITYIARIGTYNLVKSLNKTVILTGEEPFKQVYLGDNDVNEYTRLKLTGFKILEVNLINGYELDILDEIEITDINDIYYKENTTIRLLSLQGDLDIDVEISFSNFTSWSNVGYMLNITDNSGSLMYRNFAFQFSIDGIYQVV